MWTLDPQTGDDMFAACSGCAGTEPPHQGEMERRRRNRCPKIPRSEWYEGERRPVGPGGEDKLEPDDHCPGAYARMPAAVQASDSWRWWDKGQIDQVYPLGLTRAVRDGVTYFDSVRREWQSEGARLDRESVKRSSND